MRTTLSNPVLHKNSSNRFRHPPCHFHNLFFTVILFFTKKLNGSGEIRCEWLGLISLGL